MMRLIAGLVVALSLLTTPVSGEVVDFTYPQFPEKGSEVSDWVLPGWKKIVEAKGDLNKEGRDDIAFILELKKPATHLRGCSKEMYTSETAPRILLILLARKQGGYRLSAAEPNLVRRADEGGSFGDPLESLTIERGSVVLRHYGGSWWRWFQTYRFRHQDGGWFLIGFTDGSHYSGSQLTTTYDYNPLTGKIEILATDDEGRPGCYACLPGERCPSIGRCEKGSRQAKREVTWLKTKKRPLVPLRKTYCRYSNDKILPFAPRW